MAKKKVGSQIDSLILDHYQLRIALIYLHAGGVPHIARKLSTKVTTLLWISP